MKRERGLISDCTYNSKGEAERDEEKRREWGGGAHTHTHNTHNTHKSPQLEDEDNEFV